MSEMEQVPIWNAQKMITSNFICKAVLKIAVNDDQNSLPGNITWLSG